jgi:hypothetical protein
MLTARFRMSQDSPMQETFNGRMRYAHRMNEDGTLDSICPRCFVTIGTSTWEADLDRMESAHRCDPEQLRHFEPNERELMLRKPVKVVAMDRRA